MSFADLQVNEVEQEKDIVGGSYSVLESDIYPAIISMAYKGESRTGARYVHLILDINGHEHSETIYITSGESKGKLPYYEKDGKKYALPGFNIMDAVVFIATKGDKRINSANLKFEPKVIDVWDNSEAKKVKKEVQTLSDIIGKEITVCIQKVKKNKYSNGSLINESREENNIVKVLTSKLKTMTEQINKENPVFSEKWLDKNKGVTKDLFKEVNSASNSNSSVFDNVSVSTTDSSLDDF